MILQEINRYLKWLEELKHSKNTLIKINKTEGYPKPQNSWLAGNIKTDLFESLNKEKRSWIAKLVKDGIWDPILVTPIKDSGYYLLTDGWHRVQAAKKLKQKEIEALPVPADIGLSMAKANKILRDIDREYGFKLKCSDIIGQWAFYKD